MTEDQPQLPEQPTQGHATASQAVPPGPQVPPVVTTEQWAAGFRRTHHREPTMSEYQAAVHAGLITPARWPRDPAMQQMADGARQVANGARDFFNTKVAPAVEKSGAKEFLSNRVAPAAQNAARSMQQSTSRPGLAKLRGPATFMLPAAAFPGDHLAVHAGRFSHGLLGQLLQRRGRRRGRLPALHHARGHSRLCRSSHPQGELVPHHRGVIGIVAGLIDGFGTMGSVSGTRYASVGAGVVLLALLSVVMLAAAVLILLPPRQTPAILPMPSMPPAQPLES
jgi:hypothetical protein